MSQTAAVTTRSEPKDAPEAIPTATTLAQPVFVEELGDVEETVRTLAERTGLPLVRAHNVDLPAVQLEVDDMEAFFDTARTVGANRVYLWKEPLHPRASLETQDTLLAEAIRDAAEDIDDPEEQEAATELVEEMEHARGLLEEHGTLVYGTGFLLEGIMHTTYLIEDGTSDAAIVLATLLEVSGGQSDDDDDDDLHEMDPDEAATRIIEHVEDDMEIPPREIRRRANELARQAAHQLVDMDELSPAEKQRVQQAIKAAAVRMRKG